MQIKLETSTSTFISDISDTTAKLDNQLLESTKSTLSSSSTEENTTSSNIIILLLILDYVKRIKNIRTINCCFIW